MSKERKTNDERKSRWLFRFYLLYPTVLLYSLLYFFSNGAIINNSLNDILMSIVIGNFACTITAVSIFAVFDYKESNAAPSTKENKKENNADLLPENNAVLLTKENKIYFIDAILLALCNMIFSLAFSGNNNAALFFIVIISCYHTFIIFHYYLRERFNRKQQNEIFRKIIKFLIVLISPIRKALDFIFFPTIRKVLNFPIIRTALDFSIIFIPAILFFIFDWKFSGNSSLLISLFYIIFSVSIIGCILVKEIYLEVKNKTEESV